MFYLEIDIGGTEIKYGTYDQNGLAQEYQGIVPTRAEDLVELVELLGEIITEAGEISGVGISVPGAVNPYTGLIIEGGAVKVLDKVKLISQLEKYTPTTIKLENDANCALLAEKWQGHGQQYENIICITIGTGIGGSLIINNQLYRGSHFLAGEFGFMLQQVRLTTEKYADYSSTSATMPLLKAVNKVKTEMTELTGFEVFAMLEAGDEEVKKIYHDWLHKLALGVHNIGFILDPDIVLIGGGVSAVPRIVADLQAEVDRLKNFQRNWEIKACSLRNQAGKMGAAYLAISNEGKSNYEKN